MQWLPACLPEMWRSHHSYINPRPSKSLNIWTRHTTMQCFEAQVITAVVRSCECKLCPKDGVGTKLRSGVVVCYEFSVVSYQSTLQKCVTISSTEDEYVAWTESTKYVVWLRLIFFELGIQQEWTAVTKNNTCAMRWAAGHLVEGLKRSKDFEVWYHHVRDEIISGEIHVEKTGMSEIATDFLAKAMNGDQAIKTKAWAQLVHVTMAHQE